MEHAELNHHQGVSMTAVADGRVRTGQMASDMVAHVSVAAAYTLIAQLGFRVATVHPVVASVWPPAGFALAILILFGLRFWPGIFLGALAANALKDIPLPAAALMGFGNTWTAVLGAAALRRFGFDLSFPRVRDAFALLGIGALGSPVVAATIGTISLHFLAGVPDHLAGLWFTWWSGDALGVMLMTPLLLAWVTIRSRELTAQRVAEKVLVGVTLLCVSAILIRTLNGYEYAIIPLVGWASIRRGPLGGSLAAVLVAGTVIWYTSLGTGPFVGDGGDGLWRLQLFLAILTTTSLVIAALATAQVKISDALRNSENRFRRIFEHAGIGMTVVHPDGRIAQANPAFHEMLGLPVGALTGRAIADITHPDDWKTQRLSLQELLSGGSTPYRVVKRYLRPDGTVFWGKVTATYIPDGGDGPGCTIGLVEDISQQRAAQEALARDEEELRRTTRTLKTLIDAAPLAIYTLDPEGRVLSWNHAAEQMFGWPAAEVVGRALPIITPEEFPAFRVSLDKVFAGEALTGLQIKRPRRDGIKLDLRIYAAPTQAADGSTEAVIAIVEDVTERSSLGEQLRQAQKMEAIGQLTGGIAHDFNNILTVVITNAALLADQVATDEVDMRAELCDLQRAALRGADLIRKLMAFSRQSALEIRPINLTALIRDSERSLRRLLPDSIEIASRLDIDADLTISGDAGAFEQMLFNLATNARDAMPKGGKLHLQVYRACLDEEHRRVHGWGAVGEYIVIAVSDTGCGMNRETRVRVFDPFFTTKPAGKGTGLGLAMVYGLMKQHNGYIGVYSEPGHGTTFRLYFPASATGVAASGPPSALAPVAGGSERILVVDDEEGIRRSAARVLRRAGYSVVDASDGEAALTLLNQPGTAFDLVLSDLVMPRLGGLGLYQELRGRKCGTRILLMSGYTAEDVRAQEGAHPGLVILHKPWSVTDLLRRVRETLDQPVQ
jgi:PAS domain S-box-containing protein